MNMHRLFKNLIIITIVFFNIKLFSDAKKDFEEAMREYKIGNYGKASELFYNITQKYPNTDWTIAATYYSAFCTKDLESSITTLQTVIDSYPDSPYSEKALYYCGIYYYYIGDYDNALKTLGNYLIVSSDKNKKEKANIYLIKTLLGGKYYKDTLEEISKFYKKYPIYKRNEKIMMYKFIATFKSKDYKNSIEIGRKFLKKFPKSKQRDKIYYYLYKSYQNLNQKSLAQKYFELLKINYPLSRYLTQEY